MSLRFGCDFGVRRDAERELVYDIGYSFGLQFIVLGVDARRLPDEINLGRRRVLPPGPKRRILGLGAFQPPEDTAEERHSRAGMMRADANLSRAATEQELL